MAIAVAAAVLLTGAGAFGTAGLPLPIRLAYWLVLLAGGTLVGVLVMRGVDRFGLLADQPWTQVTATAVLMTVPYTAVVWLVTRTVFHTAGYQGVLDFAVPVFVISMAMCAVNLLASRRPAETHLAEPGAPAPKFLDRLPLKLKGAALHAVEAEDHYLRLHTDRGSDLILMRLSDALGELEGLEGAQTHRSWWVSKDAVVGARRDGARAILQLKSGAEAPVSRNYVKSLKDQGWF